MLIKPAKESPFLMTYLTGILHISMRNGNMDMLERCMSICPSYLILLKMTHFCIRTKAHTSLKIFILRQRQLAMKFLSYIINGIFIFKLKVNEVWSKLFIIHDFKSHFTSLLAKTGCLPTRSTKLCNSIRLQKIKLKDTFYLMNCLWLKRSFSTTCK